MRCLPDNRNSNMLRRILPNRIFRSWRSRPKDSRISAKKAIQTRKIIPKELERTGSNFEPTPELFPATLIFHQKGRKLAKIWQNEHDNRNQLAWRSVAETSIFELDLLKTFSNQLKLNFHNFLHQLYLVSRPHSFFSRSVLTRVNFAIMFE